MAKIEYVSFQDKVSPSDWRVEAIDDKTGEVYITLFAGPDAEERSVEYAAFKNGTHPLFKKTATAPSNLLDAIRKLYYAAVWRADRPVDEAGLWTAVRNAAGFEPGNSPVEIPRPPAPRSPVEMIQAALPNTFRLVTDNGHEILITPSEVKWNYDARRKVLTGRPRPAIEIQKGFSPKG